MPFDKNQYQLRFNEAVKQKRIRESTDHFKIKLFLQKAENSLLIAKFHKDIKPKNYIGIIGP